ncbi:hypothetical protein Droror1_Dr00019261 [Drosera rotundifolia]
MSNDKPIYCNYTIPHKVAGLECCDEVDPIAKVRGLLAQQGYEKLDDVIGRTDLLKPKDISVMKTQHLDLSYVLSLGQWKLWRGLHPWFCAGRVLVLLMEC